MSQVDFKVDVELLKRLPENKLLDHRVLPLINEENHDDFIVFITDNKVPLPFIDELKVYIGKKIKMEFISKDVLNDLLDEYLISVSNSVEGMLEDFETNQLEEYVNLDMNNGVENLEELAQEAPIIKLVNVIIISAIKKGASDIHLEPYQDKIRLRYRIDGLLYNNPAPPKNLLPAIVTRIKIMANLNIAEHRLPQEGRVRIKVQGRELDIRISIIPNLNGESVVMRILDRAAVLMDLNNLGFEQKILESYKNVINYTHGIVLVTGPTGSGKTTTLYATLNLLNSNTKKIITIEDPVEYQLDGIMQVAVRPEIDFTFASGLRSFLRHDPNIIMVGEIRDVETAKIAIQAALTGHLVFATLHTNDATGAITRLLDMGIEDYLLASVLKAVLAQRLVRIICNDCKKQYNAKKEQQIFLEKYPNYNGYLYKGEGCEECNYIGYRGRTGIYELIEIDSDLQSLISRGVDLNQIKDTVARKGGKTLREDGWTKVKDGITTVDEVLRATKG